MPADQEEIHRLSLSENADDRVKASQLLIDEFGSLPDKSAAWDDLHRLTSDKDSGVRRSAAAALGIVFSSVPDKSVAWDDLHKLINEEDIGVRFSAANALGFAFSFVLDKSAAWDDLHKLINDYYLGIRWIAVDALGSAFSSVPDKSVAWDDLHKLINDEDLGVRWHAVAALGSAFSSVPNKSAAWDDLHKLINDKDSGVRRSAADVLGSAFSLIPNEYKTIIWSDLHKLAIDEDYSVRFYATYSLGKICIYNASKSEIQVDSRALLEKAIQFFEKAIQFFVPDTLESDGGSPAHFCYPFYCAFDAVLFKKVNSKKEIENYIASARREIWGSESKQKLIESIEQLAEALEIAHDAHESGSNWQETLKRCSDICNHAEQLMEDNKEKTPAIHDLYKIAKPSFDKTITELIDNIREKIEIGRKKAVGTPFESLYDNAEKEVKEWKTGTEEENLAVVECIVSLIRDNLPHEKVEVIHDELNRTIIEKNIPELLEGIRKMIQENSSYADISKVEVLNKDVKDLLLQVAQLTKETNQIRETTDKTYEKVTQIDKKTLNINETTIRTENKVDLLLQTVNELTEIASKLKEEGNEKGSQDVNDIADKIKVLFENKDPREITLFIEKLRENVPSLFEEIEKSTAPKDVKEKAKKGLKEAIMETGKDITSGVATNWIAAYLTSIVMVGAPGLLVLGTILTALISIENIKNQR